MKTQTFVSVIQPQSEHASLKDIGSISLRGMHFTLKMENKPTEHQKDHGRQTMKFLNKKKMTTHNIYNVHTHPGRFIYALYIFQSTHKLPIWQVEKIGIHLGKVMKEKTTEENESYLHSIIQ